MNITKEKKKEEALRRMKLLHLSDDVIEQFERDGTVCISTFGIPTPVSDEMREEIEKYEERTNSLVYTVVHSKNNYFGDMDSLLIVSDYEEDLVYEIVDASNIVFAYVINRKYDGDSEHGSIVAVPTRFGGLIRTDL